jgi:hypothetical protein
MMEQRQTDARTPFSNDASNQAQLAQAIGIKSENPRSSPETEPIENMSLSATMDTQMVNAPPVTLAQPSQAIPLGNAPGVQQPKVQTAFIHKLYKYCSISFSPGLRCAEVRNP